MGKRVLPNLGIMGKMGSGKGFGAKHLARKYGYKHITMGNVVRALARKEKIKPTRENLEKLQKKYSKNGGDFVIEKVLEKVSKIKSPIILDGIRKPLQAQIAKKKLNIILIEVYATPKIRFARMKKRGRSADSGDFKKFKEREAMEEKIFGIGKTLRLAKYRINNDDGEKRFFRDLDSVMNKIIK